MTANTEFGIEAEDSAYRENVVNGNAGGTVGGTGAIDLGANSCNGAATCP